MYALNMVILNAYWAVVNMFGGKNEEGQGMVEYATDHCANRRGVDCGIRPCAGGNLNTTFTNIGNGLDPLLLNRNDVRSDSEPASNHKDRGIVQTMGHAATLHVPSWRSETIFEWAAAWHQAMDEHAMES